MLIALPHGLGVSGVTMWAMRLANVLVRRGRAAGLIVHPEPPGVAPIDLPIGAGVAIFRLPAGVPPIDECGGDLGPYLPWYRSAIGAMLDRAAAPVVLSPNLHGDCYGIGAALTREFGDRLRLVGWQHGDIAYDARLLEWFEPVLSAFVGVSDRIGQRLEAILPDRAGDVRVIPYGVEVADGSAPKGPAMVARGDKVAPATEEPLVRVSRSPFAPKGQASVAAGPVRLLYTGRIEHHQKRILALPLLSRELSRRGIHHELTIVGDGPAASDLNAAIDGLPSVRRLGPAAPPEVTRLLGEHDALVLASRYEGLSVSMLEGLARGCTPIVTRTESGALQAITDGENGLIADVSPDADEPAAAAALADAVERFVRLESARPGALSDAAYRTVRDRFSLERHVERVESLLDRVAASAARTWPSDRVCAFTGRGGGSGSVPPGGARRMADALRELAGRKVVIHGTGRHTLELEHVIRDSPAEIVAFADDDRQKHGTRLWDRPVIAPGEAPTTGATDVVISSWMHEEAIWARRTAYEAGRLLVRRLYA